MCLDITKTTTNRIRKVLDTFGKFTAYKVVYINTDGAAASRYRSEFRWKAGWNYSNRTSTKINQFEDRCVNRGIHVYLTAKQAERSERLKDYKYLGLIPVTCYKKDFVAGGNYCGYGSAVFTKVWVARKDLDKAIAKTKGK